MRVFKAFAKGFSTTNKKARMLIYLWLVNLLFSVLMVTPVYFLLKKDISSSLATERIGQGWDFIWMGDFIYKYRDFFPALIGWLIIPGILYFLFYIFFNGGIIGRITAGDKIRFSNFLADCSKYFFRFLRVFLISLLGYFIVFGLLYRGISYLFGLWTKNASTEWLLIISSNLKFLILLLLFSIVRMFFDYVKIRLVVEESKKTIRATIANFSFMANRFFKAWFLYILVGLVVILFGVIFFWVRQNLPSIGLLIIVTFIWQQIYVFSKMWTKVLFFSTEYHFFKGD